MVRKPAARWPRELAGPAYGWGGGRLGWGQDPISRPAIYPTHPLRPSQALAVQRLNLPDLLLLFKI